MTEITIVETIRQSLPIKDGNILEQIKKNYSIPESDLSNVEQFLDKHKDIANLILDACTKIRDFFTSETLLLELISDISIEGGEELFVYIQTYLSVEEAVEKINNFDEQWFF